MSKKRSAGEGSIVKRSDGRWCGALAIPSGKRRWIYGRTRREVADKLGLLAADLRRGLVLVDDRRLLGAFLEEWLEKTAKPKLRISTFISYSTIVRKHLAPDLGRVQLRKLQPQHVQDFMIRKLAAGYSPRRVIYMRAVLRHALNQALKWQIVARNVAALVDPPRAQSYEIEPLTEHQVVRLLEVARGDRLEALYAVAVAMGLRQGEALGLRWDDVDLERGLLSVRHTLQRIDHSWVLQEPKTTRSRRTLQMPAQIVSALRVHKASQIAERLFAGEGWDDWGLVFTTRTGKPLDGTNVTTGFKRLLHRAGLPSKRFHDLRHSCATLLLAQGVPARVVMDILGHSQIGLTLNTYSHVLPELQAEAATRMGAFLARATNT